MFKNKRGISEVITFVLIILLVLVAIAIVWQVVIPLIQKPAQDISTKCITENIQIQSARWINEDTLEVLVKRGGGSDEITMNKIAVLVTDSEGSTKYIAATDDVADDTTTGTLAKPLKPLESAKITLLFEAGGDKPTKVEVAPVLNAGDKDKECEIQDSISGTAIKTATDYTTPPAEPENCLGQGDAVVCASDKCDGADVIDGSFGDVNSTNVCCAVECSP